MSGGACVCHCGGSEPSRRRGMSSRLELVALPGLPMVGADDDLADLIATALTRDGLRAKLQQRFGATIGVIISDSFGRAWRRGTCGIAIGAAGLPSLIDLRGQPDLFGRTLEVSIIGFADEIAAAASLLQGQAAEAQPVVVVRGLTWQAPNVPVADMIRPPEEDLFQ